MFLNISEILTVPFTSKEYTVLPDFDKLVLRRVSYPVSKKEPFILKILKDGNRLHLDGETVVRLIMPCDRCLSDVEITFPIRIRRDVSLQEESDGDYDADELSFIDGCIIDTDKLVLDEIVVALPTKILCREDCAGLCPTCGRNLNEGPCDCHTDYSDPRMAAIADIFRDFNPQDEDQA